VSQTAINPEIEPTTSKHRWYWKLLNRSAPLPSSWQVEWFKYGSVDEVCEFFHRAIARQLLFEKDSSRILPHERQQRVSVRCYALLGTLAPANEVFKKEYAARRSLEFMLLLRHPKADLDAVSDEELRKLFGTALVFPRADWHTVLALLEAGVDTELLRSMSRGSE
jgi:hypothetical protein